ncbi:MFS transporter [Catenulispora subtropica]|uniref:MFS transporter n=1 Tax=Catenulispora subtropica TaxID=450798 RepID=A0ABP5BU09_9ACTN
MRKWLPLVAVCLGTFMLLVDVTIVTVALPDMARSLHTTFADLQWVMDVYALVLAALLLAAGSLGDRAGHRRLYTGGLVVFAAASLACGLATDPGELIAFRAVQGVGGAAMLATTVALISHLYSGRDRGTAFGVWGAVNGAAAAAGPIMGGLLTQHLDWRWIFFVNLPISVAAVAMTLRYVGESRGERRGRLDLTGLLTFTAAAGLATYALIKGNDYGWSSSRTLGTFAVAGVALIAFVVAELRSQAPLLDLGLFRRGTFTGVMIGALMLSGAAFSYLAYESLWLQSVLNMGPVTAGLCFLPMSVAAFFTAAQSGKLEGRIPPRLPIGVGLLLIAGGAAAQSVVGAGSDWVVLVPGLLVTGVGVGLSTPMLVSTAVSAVGYQRAGMASGAVNTARQLGNALGIAVLGVLFHSGLSSSAHDAGIGGLTDRLASGQSGMVLAQTAPEQRAVLDHLVHAAFASGLRSAMLGATVAGVVGGLAVLLLVRRPAAVAGAAGAAAPLNPAAQVVAVDA